MIVKQCGKPTSGGSAVAGVKYILGYSLGTKDGDQAQQRESYLSLLSESLAREDFGVGTIWQPAAGEGLRPSSVYAKNVVSLATADVEIEALSAYAPLSTSPIEHIVFSVSEEMTQSLDERELVSAAEEVLGRAGYSNCPQVYTVHRDSDNLHVHAIVGIVDRVTLTPVLTKSVHSRLHRHTREVEVIYRDGRGVELGNDRGLWVVRDVGTSEQRIEKATGDELRTWRIERNEKREQLRNSRSYEYVQNRETFERFCNASVIPRILQAVESVQDVAPETTWAEIHRAAAGYGVEVIRELDEHGQEKVWLTTTIQSEDGTSRDLRSEWDNEAARATYLDRVAAEDKFAIFVRANPYYIADRLTQSEAAFGRDALTRFIADRSCDPAALDLLPDLVLADERVVALSLDAEYGVYTTKEMRDTDGTVRALSKALASQVPSHADYQAMDRAIIGTEHDRSIRIGDEQRHLLNAALQRNIAVGLGDPGTGKTTVMDVVRRYGEEVDRPVVGFTISAAAAQRLQDEAGFPTDNLARLLNSESSQRALLPRSIVVLDEAGMIDTRTMQRVLKLANDRACSVIAIGDPRQLPAIEAGCPFLTLRDETRAVGTYAELHEVHRQKNAWHRDVVQENALALRTGNDALILSGVQCLAAHDALIKSPNSDEALKTCVDYYVAHKDEGTTLLIAASRDDVRYLNEAARAATGTEGRGTWFTVEHGARRQLTEGDRFIFRENETRDLGVLNGYTGTVVAASRSSISVALDHERRTVTFDPRSYISWDHGFATTIHAAQGASVDYCASYMSKSSTAETYHVATSRSKLGVAVVYSEAAFENDEALGEHIAQRSIAKGTSEHISNIVDRTGGPNTPWARSVNAQRALLSQPQRDRYELETAMRRAQCESEKERAIRDAAKQITSLAPGDSKGRRATLKAAVTRVKALETMHSMPSFDQWSKYVEQPIPDFLRERAAEMRNEASLEGAKQVETVQPSVSWEEFIASQRERSKASGLYQESQQMARAFDRDAIKIVNPLPQDHRVASKEEQIRERLREKAAELRAEPVKEETLTREQRLGL